MKKTFVQRLLAVYPDWHNKPHNLSSAEINNPFLVVDEFFDCFDLGGFREDLKEMQLDAVAVDNLDDPTMYLRLNDHIIRLTEACFVLYQKKIGSVDFLEDEDYGNEDMKNDPSFIDDEENGYDTEVPQRFTKLIRPKEFIRKDILKGVNRIFLTIELEVLNESLQLWLNAGLCNELGSYEHPTERADLITYVNSLYRLFEALHVYCELEKVKEYVGKDRLSPRLFADFKKNVNYSLLDDDELLEPLEVVTDFFEQFPFRYARIELWDLLDAVITYEGTALQAVEKNGLLLTYECMDALLHAARRLNERKEKNEQPEKEYSESKPDINEGTKQ